ncbi:MAG: 50S ribosomal protein L17 [Candidatus Latescibacterota bacterium]|nr:MAG: 50S ribosomal protein L17 [Candidatus Latescibacterota bacterium]
MRHQVAVRKLGRTTAHRRAMLRNMVTSLFQHERIRTTTPKAKVARRYAERMITFGKRGDLHARRQAARFINDETVLKKLFDEIAPKMAERPGGYTRILRSGFRKGDAADVAILELVTHSAERTKKGNRKSAERLAEFVVAASPAAKASAGDEGEREAEADQEPELDQ